MYTHMAVYFYSFVRSDNLLETQMYSNEIVTRSKHDRDNYDYYDNHYPLSISTDKLIAYDYSMLFA